MSTWSSLNDGDSKTANTILSTDVYEQITENVGYGKDAVRMTQYTRGEGEYFDIQRKLKKKVTFDDSVVQEDEDLKSDGSKFPTTRAQVLEVGLKKPYTKKAKVLSQVNIPEWAAKDCADYMNDIDNSGMFRELYKAKLVVDCTSDTALSAVGEDGVAQGLGEASLSYDNLVNLRKIAKDYKIPMIDNRHWKMKVDNSNEAALIKDLKGTTVDIPVQYRNSATLGQVLNIMFESDGEYLAPPESGGSGSNEVGEAILYGADAVAECVAYEWETGTYNTNAAANRFLGAYIYTMKNYKKIWDLVADKDYAEAKGFTKYGIERVILVNKHS